MAITAIVAVWATVLVAIPFNNDLDGMIKAAMAAMGVGIVLLVLLFSKTVFLTRWKLVIPVLFAAFIVSSFCFPLLFVRYPMVHVLSWISFFVTGPLFGVCIFLLGKQIRNVVIGSSFVALPVAVFSSIQAVFGQGSMETRATTTMGNPNSTAAVVFFGFAVFSALAILEKTRRRVYSTIAAICFLGLLSTNCKTAVVACIGYFLVVLLLKKIVFTKSKYKVPLLIACLFAALITLPIVAAFYIGPKHLVAVETGLSGRFLLWTSAIEVISKHVFTGCGMGQWQPDLISSAVGIIHSHNLAPLLHLPLFVYNDLLQMSLQWGILSTLLYFILLVVLGTQSFCKEDSFSHTLTFSLFGLCIFGLAQSPLTNPASSLLHWMLLGAMAGRLLYNDNSSNAIVHPAKLPVIAVIVVLSVVSLANAGRIGIGAFAILSGREQMSHQKWKVLPSYLPVRLCTEYPSMHYTVSEQLGKAGYLDKSEQELDESLALTLSYGRMLKKGFIMENRGDETAALQYWGNLCNTYPLLLTPYYRKALILDKQGDKDSSFALCKICLNKPAYSYEQEQIKIKVKELYDQLRRGGL